MNGRTVVELAPTAGLLEAADRIRRTPGTDELALVAPAGAPLMRSAVFVAVVHRLAGARPFAIVSADARARAVAASAHVRAYSSLLALEREERDATERDAPLPLAPVATVVRSGGGRGLAGRMAALSSLAAALAVAAGILVPSATVVVAAASSPVGPLDFALRAGPGGEIEAQAFSAAVEAKVSGKATGSKVVESKATGVVHVTNKTTNDITLPRGTLVRAGNVRFLTTEARNLPRSLLVPFVLSTIDVAIEAAEPGRAGNVAAGAIASTDPARYDATNPQATSGGDTRTMPVVTQADYDAAARGNDGALSAAAQAQLVRWRDQVKQGYSIVGGAAWTLTSQLGAGEVVGQEIATFDILLAAKVVAFAVPNDQPRAAAIARLRSGVDPGNDIDAGGAAVDVVGAPTVGENGVTWKIHAAARQLARSNPAVLRAALAGRAPAEVEGVLRERGLRLVTLGRAPEWWPRLPLLDARISVVEQPDGR